MNDCVSIRSSLHQMLLSIYNKFMSLLTWPPTPSASGVKSRRRLVAVAWQRIRRLDVREIQFRRDS